MNKFVFCVGLPGCGKSTYLAAHYNKEDVVCADDLEGSHEELFVTHMIQEQALDKLCKVYDKVHITDSYKDWSNVPANCEVIKVDSIYGIC